MSAKCLAAVINDHLHILRNRSIPAKLTKHFHASRILTLIMEVALLALNLDALLLATIQSITKAHLLENYS